MVLVAPALAEERLGCGGRNVKLLPKHDVVFTSLLNVDQAFAAMAAHVEPLNPFRIAVTIGFWTVIGAKGPDKFEGETTSEGFEVRRLVGFFSYFVPNTRITIRPHGDGAEIAIGLRLQALAYAVFLLPVIVGLSNGLTLDGLLAGAMMFGLFYAIVMGAFWLEATHQELVLRRIFRA
jgi:hypothetical protein